jgi:endonuclease YncB( thermonuclease family)
MIKNKYYSYINTTDATQIIFVELEVDGVKQEYGFPLKPKQVEADILQKVKAAYGKNAKIISVAATEATGVTSSGEVKYDVKKIGPATKLSKDEILKKSILMDIETTGLKGGDIIHQVAVYNPAEQKGYMFSPKPELITQDKAGGEEALSRRGPRRLVGKKQDVRSHREGKFISTLVDMLKIGEEPGSLSTELAEIRDKFAKNEISVFQLAEEVKPLVETDVALKSSIQDYLIETDRFQALLLADEDKLIKAGIGVDEAGKALSPETVTKRKMFDAISTGKATSDDLIDFIHETTGRSRGELSEKFKGGLVFKSTDSIEDLMTKDLANAIKGKITWIANASFEAKQFGAQIDAGAERSFEALKDHRASQGLVPLDRKQFFEGFQYGRYQSELSALNLAENKNLLTQNPFYGVIEGVSSTSGDPFYTTGVEYNKQRSLALKSGDFSGMYKALLEHTQEGDVRDIIDMVKAQQSQLINEGIIDQKGPTSLSMEVQGRLFGFTEQLRLAEDSGEIASIDDAVKAMREAESHMALGDVAITEDKVLKESLDQLEAKRLVDIGGREGQELLAQAKAGKGAYFRFMTYGHLSNYYNQEARLVDGTVSKGLDEIGFRQRVGKSMLERIDRGAVTIRESKPGFRVVEQAKKIGDITSKEKITVGPQSKQVRITSFDEIFDHLNGLDTYKNVDKAEILEEAKKTYGRFLDSEGDIADSPGMRKAALQQSEAAPEVHRMFKERLSGGQFSEDFLRNIQRFMGSEAPRQKQIEVPTKALGSHINKETISDGLSKPKPQSNLSEVVPKALEGGSGSKKLPPVSSAAESVSRSAKRKSSLYLNKSIREIAKMHLGKYAAIAGGLAALSTKTSYEDEKSGQLIAPDLSKFLEAQSQFYGGNQESYVKSIKAKYGRIEGMQESGLGSLMRKALTDFGSPYQGPAYTQGVLEDHQMRRERHRYIQQKFGQRHFSEKGDIGFFFKKFISTAFRRQMGISKESKNIIFSGAERLSEDAYGGSLRGKNLIEYKFDKKRFNLNVQDADTISIQRKGNVNSPLSDFMGTGKQESMSIRLAGIDAPETAHADRKAQPYAEKAKAIARDLINKAKDVRLVTSPDDTTYGRQVGMIYVDGKNLNLELVRRGAAAYLPYKSKGKPPIYNQQAFESAQEYAQDSKRGMWKTGFFQAYKEIVRASGETTTFNTLANVRKVAKNANLMSIRSLMNQAQSSGGVTDQIMDDIKGVSEKLKAGQSKNSVSVFKPDRKYSLPHDLDLQSFGYNTNSILSHMDEMKSDLGGMVKNRGSKGSGAKLNSRSLRENNYHLVKDTLSAKKVHEANKIQNQESNEMKKIQKYKRQVAMESLQVAANHNMFNSPISHHRM